MDAGSKDMRRGNNKSNVGGGGMDSFQKESAVPQIKKNQMQSNLGSMLSWNEPNGGGGGKM